MSGQRGAILLVASGWESREWEDRLRASGRDVRVWPDRIGDVADVTYACAWKPPPGLLARLPHLAAIFSLGAGVDHLMGDPALPDVPVVRIVDPDLTARMTEYVVLHVLMHHRGVKRYAAYQRERRWQEDAQPAARDVTVGIMGFGVLGQHAADALARLGFRVAGLSRRSQPSSRFEMFDGEAGLAAFLERTEILVCLLPHTPRTHGIINLPLLRRLKRHGALGGAYLINAGRGLVQVDADILVALDEGTLAGASLDVFPTEPLPADSPFWTHPRVIVTPHNAAVSDPRALSAGVLAQIERFERGQPLHNVIDRIAGY